MSRTNVEGVKGHRCRSSVNEGRCLRCASSVVRWTSAKKTVRRLIWLIVPLLLLTFVSPSIAKLQKSSGKINKSGVCQSIDIRNSVSEFSRLQGCRVVEGFVQILLIDHANDSAFSNLTFPDLVEITEYLVLYRVNGLRSVGRLFPNLTVIRGNSLFINYALVAFEMMHLQEIGLHSLTDILRGSVRFEKNPALCYTNTIDWDIIAKNGKGEHVISGNKPRNGCPICEKGCPKKETNKDEHLCWNKEHCQKMCDTCEGGTCTSTGECCHRSCLGGCSGPTASNCTACRNVMIGNTCVDRCPESTYAFMNYKCISENECRAMKKPREASNVHKDYPYKPFQNVCRIDCPVGYMDEDSNNLTTCKKCNGPCQKECGGANIDSIASAQKLRGCTHITGSLEIQIRGGKNIVKEMEDSLSMIEEIDGYLKIVRSFPLISLNFLKNLKIIRGNYVDNNEKSLIVLDNQNLQELWDWGSNKTIKILYKNSRPGKVFFHFNPKLCLQKIYKLRQVAHLEQFTDVEVAPNSNGDKNACNVTLLQVKIDKKASNAALIIWAPFEHHDPRSLLGYVVYFIEAPFQNVTMYDGRDACGGDGWKVDDVSPSETYSPGFKNNTEVKQFLTHILTKLKPYTQYAFYIKTYTIATERSGAQSEITYFTTLPGAPSVPQKLSTYSNDSDVLIITWHPPAERNGNLTHYRIVGRYEPDDSHFLEQRNYCEEPLSAPEKRPAKAVLIDEENKKVEADKQSVTEPETDTCDCSSREVDSSTREKDATSSIAFEDALHNQVYVKRPTSRRRRDVSGLMTEEISFRKRDVSSESQDKETVRKGSKKTSKDGSTKNYMILKEEPIPPDEMEDGKILKFERRIPTTNYTTGPITFVISGLRHFTTYNIEIQACREITSNDRSINDYCSTKSMKTYRTMALDCADDIPANSFQVTSTTNKDNASLPSPEVKLKWDEPQKPNGLIVTYQIEYKNRDIQNIKPTTICLTRKDFIRNKFYTLKDLPAGNYTIKARAVSLAGYGNYTHEKIVYINEYNTYGKFWIIFWIIFIIIVMSLSGCSVYVCKRKYMRSVPSMRLIATVNPEYVSTVYIPDEWEIPREKVKIEDMKAIGNGSFGMVHEGVIYDVVKGHPSLRCAVKTVNDKATDRERIEFLNEASVMKAFNTYHVVKLLGVVSRGLPTWVVMELMVNGDLKEYLRNNRPDTCENPLVKPPTLKRIVRMAIEIADGMAYLSAKKFVHRDLAARNCMVAEDLTVKIGDFGMTRDIYETDYYRKGTKGLLPVRWMAPESLKDGVFTSFSDVWSYGVVLWEMVTLALQPYQGLSNDQTLRYVIDGGVMERPENCPTFLYQLMRKTWSYKSNARPTFIDIVKVLLYITEDDFQQLSFFHTPEGTDAVTHNASVTTYNEQDLREILRDILEGEEIIGGEDSPLRQDFGDFGDFADFMPLSLKRNSSPRYALDLYSNGSKLSNFHDLNLSKVPQKAGFDDFDGVSVESNKASSKDTLNLPFAEDSVKSVKNSPFAQKKSLSRESMSGESSLAKSVSPQNSAQKSFIDSPSPSKTPRVDPDYENRSPEIIALNTKAEKTPLRMNFSSLNTIDIEISNDSDKEKKRQSDYGNRTETLNNGYIGNATT